ncbi:MAG: hypothetical protein IJ717_09050 [Treponema sp.]|nr:hypothetical protein [Treponema sp.]
MDIIQPANMKKAPTSRLLTAAAPSMISVNSPLPILVKSNVQSIMSDSLPIFFQCEIAKIILAVAPIKIQATSTAMSMCSKTADCIMFVVSAKYLTICGSFWLHEIDIKNLCIPKKVQFY